MIMNSKERVKAVLNGEIPDKVPWGEFAVDFDTVGKVIGRKTFFRAKARSAMAMWDGLRDEVVQSWKEDAIEFFKKFNTIDIINIMAMTSGIAPPKGYKPEKPKKIDENTWEYKDGTVIKYSDITADLTTLYDPNVGKRVFAPADFEKEPEIQPQDESCFEVVDTLIQEFGNERYMVGPSGNEIGILLLEGSFDEGGGGFVHGLMQYYDNPETLRAAYRYEIKKNNLLDRQFIRTGQDAVFFANQDFAGTNGPFISPEMFREFSLPAIKERVRNVHEKFNMPVFKHACGNNNRLLDMFVEAEYDVYQSIQETAGMNIAEIKQKYGSRMVPWGGVNVESLVRGTPEDVKRDVRRAMETLKPGGRYFFGTSHSIAVGTQYENFMTMVDEFEKLRNY
jgi:uroporphyrinogen-III decarboxylase